MVEIYGKLVRDLNIKPDVEPRVVFARDTRASGPRLVTALTEALKATETDYTDYKLLTTPQLHYITRCLNTKGTSFDYGEPTEQGYYEKTAAAFRKALGTRKPSGGVTVDCANGIGGPKLRELMKYLPTASGGGLDIKVVNDDVLSPERLNYQVSHSIPFVTGACSWLLTERCHSVGPTLSKPASAHHRHRKARQ